MRLPIDPRLTDNNLLFQLTTLMRDIAIQVNATSEGRVQGATNATTAAPTTGTYQLGDFVRNSAPSEAGAVSSKYVIFGWVCTAAGTPGTWKECRFLTGG